MIIETLDGRHRSERTPEEKQREIAARWASLSDEEKRSFFAIMDEFDTLMDCDDEYESLDEIVGYSNSFHELVDAHYEDRVVTIDEFCLDDYYLGVIGKSFYPQWRMDMNELFKGRYTEAIITGSIGSGKCLDGDTEFYNPEAGRRLTLKEAAKERFVNVASFDRALNKVVSRQAEVRLSGNKILGTLVLGDGRTLRLSPDHPVLTVDGWEPIGKVQKMALIATAQSVPSPFSVTSLLDEEIELVSFFLAGGSFSLNRSPFESKLTKDSPQIERIFKVLGSLMADYKYRINVENDGNISISPVEDADNKREYLVYAKDDEVRVPPSFFGLGNRQLGLFLNRVWSCRGMIEKDNGHIVSLDMASRGFVYDIQNLLLRFGIHSSVNEVKIFIGGGADGVCTWGWRLEISGANNISRFRREVGVWIGAEDVWEDTDKWLEGKFRSGDGKTRKYGFPLCQPGKDEIARKSFSEDQHWHGSVNWSSVVSYVEDEVVSPVYDVEVPGTENFVTNGIIVHNTTFCDMCLAYMFYELCMLQDPQSTFGLMPGSEIVLVCFNRDKKLARDVTFGGLKRKLEKSPFFHELGVKFGTSEMVYEKKNIRVIAVSVRSADAMGRDVFGGIIDETDFMEGSVLRGRGRSGNGDVKPFSELLHESITRRMKSRYDRAGVLPGKLLLSSSARHKNSFTNKRIKDAKEEAAVFCRDYAIYDVAPKERFSKRRFYVMVGTSRIKHKLLTKEEYYKMGQAGRQEMIDMGCRFIRVPLNFKSDFKSNIEDSIRDIAGIVTISLSPFFQMQEKIYEAIDPTLFHPLSNDTWATDETPHIDWSKLVKPYERRVGPGRRVMDIRPRRHPYAPRHVHFDLSLGAQDPAGVCIAHTADTIQVERRTREGDPILDEAPLIEVDLLLRINPPSNGEINFASVRGLVYDFMRHGYIFEHASADSFQSHDTIQQMETQGVEGEIVSVDKTMEPYTVLKTAIYEGRLSIYDYPIVFEELENLQADLTRMKIDHPIGGCFVGCTKVFLYDGSVLKIEELDGLEIEVCSVSKEGNIVNGLARGRMTKQTDILVEVVLSNGEMEVCTPEHRWMLEDGTYREAQALVLGGDRLFSLNKGHELTVESLSYNKLEEAVPVYDLEVDEHHNFILESGAAVHNSKDCADALAGVVYTLSRGMAYPAPIETGISEYQDSDEGDSWIRNTMNKSGDKALVKAGDVPSSGKPIVFSG